MCDHNFSENFLFIRSRFEVRVSMEKVKAIGSLRFVTKYRTHSQSSDHFPTPRSVVTKPSNSKEMNFGFENLQNSFFYYCFDIENFTKPTQKQRHVNVKRWCKQTANINKRRSWAPLRAWSSTADTMFRCFTSSNFNIIKHEIVLLAFAFSDVVLALCRCSSVMKQGKSFFIGTSEFTSQCGKHAVRWMDANVSTTTTAVCTERRLDVDLKIELEKVHRCSLLTHMITFIIVSCARYRIQIYGNLHFWF